MAARTEQETWLVPGRVWLAISRRFAWHSACLFPAGASTAESGTRPPPARRRTKAENARRVRSALRERPSFALTKAGVDGVAAEAHVAAEPHARNGATTGSAYAHDV